MPSDSYNLNSVTMKQFLFLFLVFLVSWGCGRSGESGPDYTRSLAVPGLAGVTAEFRDRTMTDTVTENFLLDRVITTAGLITWQVFIDTLSGTTNIDLIPQGSVFQKPTNDQWINVSGANVNSVLVVSNPDTTLRISYASDTFAVHRLQVVQDNGAQGNRVKVGVKVVEQQ